MKTSCLVGFSDSIEISCIEQLRRLILGDFFNWYGLPTRCSRTLMAEALGQSQWDTDLYAKIGGISTRYRIYLGKVSPHGIYVWYEQDSAVALQTHSVTPICSITEQLGEPEAKEISRMLGLKMQWIYSSRGLTLHIDKQTGAIAWLNAYRPMALDEYRSSWLYRVEMLRQRIE